MSATHAHAAAGGASLTFWRWLKDIGHYVRPPSLTNLALAIAMGGIALVVTILAIDSLFAVPEEGRSFVHSIFPPMWAAAFATLTLGMAAPEGWRDGALACLLGVILGFAAWFAADFAGYLLESWLLEVFPAAQAFRIGGFGAGFAVVLTCVLTGPSDARSALRSLLAALVVFEAAVAGGIAAALLVVTLQSSNLRLATVDIWLVAPVFIVAVLLVGHREGGWNAGAGDPVAKGEPPV